MDNEAIVEVLSSWNAWENDMKTGRERPAYLKRIEQLVRTGQVVVITGARRTGKSTLMRQFVQGRIGKGQNRRSFLYINLEEPRFADMLSTQFLQQAYDAYKEIVQPKEKPIILLDEVQNVDGWERFVRSLHEKEEAHVLVSGSTSRLLSRELGTLLTGRWVELQTYPLTFQEFIAFKGVILERETQALAAKTRIKQLLREYLEFGGFPLVALNEEKGELLRRYFDDIISRDIAERNRVRQPDKLRALAKHYLTGFASLVSLRKMARFLGTSADTVERFSSYMEEAYFLFFLPKFAFSLREQQANPRKVYGGDLGLVNIAGFRFSEDKGRLYENAVYLSLKRAQKEIYYFKGKGECDFIVKEGRTPSQAIQVSYHIGNNKERELRGLTEALDAFKLKEGLVITEDKEAVEKVGSRKIRYVPLWKWLLQKEKS
jgi:uncharacterized protein